MLLYVDDDEKSDEDEELDKQMGNLGGAEADKLDERLWGDDEEEEEDEDENDSDIEDNITETGPGMDEVKLMTCFWQHLHCVFRNWSLRKSQDTFE